MLSRENRDNALYTQSLPVNDKARALANWDPSYPLEKVNFYQEYIHRHAPINIGWLRLPRLTASEDQGTSEAVGVGLLHGGRGDAEHVVAPMDDGSVCIWDIRTSDTPARTAHGSLVAQSSQALLTGRRGKETTLAEARAIMTEVGAVESMSIDDVLKRGYFAQNNTLVQVDLSTLQVVSQETFPFPITALSSQARQSSLVVGTNCTIHVHDPRSKANASGDPSLRCELIAGPSAGHATLSQPGPLSILDRVDDDSIWVAGRFTHLLNYDRRFFPRLRGTVHSGARVSCITTLPFPHIPRSFDLLQHPGVSLADLHAAKSRSGATLLAAGEYKGKGSLELYSLNPTPRASALTTSAFANRQTASSTKLLSIAPHGCATVFSDGDGNLKWVERDGTTAIRSHNINTPPLSPSPSPAEPYREHPSFNQAQSAAQNPNDDDATAAAAAQGDIVQKIVPLRVCASSSASSASDATDRSGPLLLKTGDGRVGILGFGHASLYGREQLETKAESVEESARRDAEKQYQDRLRRALVNQANEVRFVRGLGMPFADWRG
ncbi:hypothetical protein MBLNU459_g5731t1 [Dothideomycetes sp. NU459]